MNFLSNNIFQEQVNTTWIENLALEEINMDESGIINFHNHLDPKILLEESSIDFMNQVRERVDIYVQKFNEYRGSISNNAQIKVFKISNTVNDFMIFRNSLRLIFARKSNDIISIGFLSNTGQIMAPRISRDDQPMQNITHEIKAHIGPFNNISWRFQGEPVDIDSMIRHYISEFLRTSAR